MIPRPERATTGREAVLWADPDGAEQAGCVRAKDLVAVARPRRGAARACVGREPVLGVTGRAGCEGVWRFVTVCQRSLARPSPLLREGHDARHGTCDETDTNEDAVPHKVAALALDRRKDVERVEVIERESRVTALSDETARGEELPLHAPEKRATRKDRLTVPAWQRKDV